MKLRDFIYDPSLVLYLPLWKKDGSAFMSDDAYGHLCTVTGATWGLQGRDFDGIDDTIVVAHHASLAFTTQAFTISLWIRPDTTPITQTALISKGDTADGYWGQIRSNNSVWFSTNDDGGFEESKSTAGDVSALVWQYLTIRKKGAAVTMRKDGANLTMATSATHTDVGASTSGLYIGLFSFGGAPYDGKIGDVLIYNRFLSDEEDARNYQVTKWRYQ